MSIVRLSDERSSYADLTIMGSERGTRAAIGSVILNIFRFAVRGIIPIRRESFITNEKGEASERIHAESVLHVSNVDSALSQTPVE